MNNIRQRVACKALIYYGSKILILREAASYKDGTNRGAYHLPGGRIEPGEHFLDGLVREVKEETSLEVVVGGPLYVGEWHPVIHGEKNQIVGIFFLCRAKSKRVTLSEEHDKYRWIDPHSYDKDSLVNPDNEVIDAYIVQQAKS